jgi:hypothetical protein
LKENEPYTLKVAADTYELLAAIAENRHVDVKTTLEKMVREQSDILADMTTEGALKGIEFEQLMIKVPKQVMELLRFAGKTDGDTPKDYIERNVLDAVRADIDADALIQNTDLIKMFELKPIYIELLGSY